MSENLGLVWAETRYDSGLYDCKVERDGDTGHLTVSLVGTFTTFLLHEETVKVERADTDKWRTRCAAVISNPDLRVIERR